MGEALTQPSARLRGLFWIAIAVLIWAAWLVVTTSGQATELAVMDLALLRTGVPALILAPVLWRGRAELRALGLGRILALALYGAPFTLSVAYGLTLAPSAHAGAMVPGMMPLFAALLGVAILRERLNHIQLVGLLLILLAAGLIVFAGGLSGGPSPGHRFFLIGALCWAAFTVTLKTVSISAFLVTGLVGAISAFVLLPIWVISGFGQVLTAPVSDFLFQIVFQGLLTGFVSVFAFGKALELLGESARGASALVPGLAALMAIPVLGQVPSGAEVVALALVILGIWVVARKGPDRS